MKSGQSRSLRGYTCGICGEIGVHFDSDCPDKAMVGKPEVLRQKIRAMEEVAFMPMPDGYLPEAVMISLIRKRPDVPHYLRCIVCTELASGAIWCATCDTVSCSLCLAPIDEPWVCPNCNSSVQDSFHVVSAIRNMVDDWLKAMVILQDEKLLQDECV
jgi:hypothetical protein